MSSRSRADDASDDAQTKLPNLDQGDAVTAGRPGTQPATTPSRPARYTEASLIKELEERGIGRPSTYASIVTTIQDRGYVYKKGTALVPAWIALQRHAPAGRALRAPGQYDFTAELERRARQGRRRPRGAHRRAAELLERRRSERDRPEASRRRPRRHRRPRTLHLPARRRRQPARRPATARISKARR